MKRRIAAGPHLSQLPAFIPPCLATLASTVPDGGSWLHEIKFDGYRLQARIENAEVRLLTRTGLDWTARFSTVARALAKLDAGAAIIDGEVVVETDDGRSSFTALVDELKAGRSSRMTYYAFDLLHLDAPLLSLPLIERKQRLAPMIERASGKQGPIRYSEHLVGDARHILANACALGLEGIISKRADLPYRSGRSSAWLKSKCAHDDEFIVVGYMPSNVAAEAIGSLVLAAYERKALVYVGRAGTGYSAQRATELWHLLQPMRTKAPAFARKLDALQRRGVIWVAPHLVAQIEYRGWTGDGLLRQAAFKRLREDKPAADVLLPQRK